MRILGVYSLRNLGGDSKNSTAHWDCVVAVTGHLLKPVDRYPLRFEVEGFPASGELGAMGAGPICG